MFAGVSVVAFTSHPEVSSTFADGKPADILSNTDLLNKMPDYVEEGNECYEVRDFVERGDCFQDVHSRYTVWQIDTSKEHFYFPTHHDQSHWRQIFYYDILTNDELGEIVHTEDYDDYVSAIDYGETHIQKAEDLLHDLWYIFSSIIPQENREMLTRFTWYDTGQDFTFAVGIPDENSSERQFTFSHNLEFYTQSHKKVFLHEYAHMFTLDEGQIEIDDEVLYSDDDEDWKEAEKKCSTLFTVWGCAKEDSYLYAFYKEFWEDIHDEYEDINWYHQAYYKKFFTRHEDRFYTSYQGTRPEEDIADSFSIFVMQPSEVAFEAEEMKDEKLAFFYEYDELVNLRTEILENIFELNKKDGEFY